MLPRFLWTINYRRETRYISGEGGNVNIVEHKTRVHNVPKNSYNIYQSIVMNIAEDNNKLKEIYILS